MVVWPQLGLTVKTIRIITGGIRNFLSPALSVEL
jgi:hypothetical protein